MINHQGKVLLTHFAGCWRQLFRGKTLLLTNTVSAGVLLSIGDIIQQTREVTKDDKRERDWKRTGRLLVMGCCMGPLDHYWYVWLDRILPGTALKIVLKKVLVEQILASPILGALFFTGLGTMEGQGLTKSWRVFQGKFWEMYKVEWCVWPPAQIINFYFLPPKYRVIYVNFISLGWDVYLSYLIHKTEDPGEKPSMSEPILQETPALKNRNNGKTSDG